MGNGAAVHRHTAGAARHARPQDACGHPRDLETTYSSLEYSISKLNALNTVDRCFSTPIPIIFFFFMDIFKIKACPRVN